MKIILIGGPGSGKSTQGKLLSKKLALPYLASGDIFRRIAKEKTKWGRYVRKVVNGGLLVPDQKVTPIVEEYLKRKEYKKGYILDGFPRTLSQVKAFTHKIDQALYIKVSDKEALKRLSLRKEAREDDNALVLKKRLKVYHQLTDPIIGHYQKKGILVEIDGEREIDEIHREILELLK